MAKLFPHWRLEWRLLGQRCWRRAYTAAARLVVLAAAAVIVAGGAAAAQNTYLQDTSRTYSPNEKRALYPGFFLGDAAHPYGAGNIGSISMQVSAANTRSSAHRKQVAQRQANARARRMNAPSGRAIGSWLTPQRRVFRRIFVSCQVQPGVFVTPLRLLRDSFVPEGFVGAMYRCADKSWSMMVQLSPQFPNADEAARFSPANAPAEPDGSPEFSPKLMCPAAQTLFINNLKQRNYAGLVCGMERVPVTPAPPNAEPVIIEQYVTWVPQE